MSQSTSANTQLTSQYAAQVATDLEHNLKEQDRIAADIAALQEQLASLRHDHSVLVNVQQALGFSATPIQSADGQDAGTVPAPRQKTSGEPGAAGKRTRAKKATAEDGKTAKEPSPTESAATKSASTKATRKTAAAKTAGPTLVELVRSHLAAQSEPRSAAEVATALGTAHPERGIKTTVVRTTLEGLVARNQAQRAKQGSSVFYVTPQTTAPLQGEAGTEQAE